MIVVTGATGQLGRGIVEGLLKRVPAGGIAAGVRQPDRAADFARRGVQVRAGDFADPDRLATLFIDATIVLLVSVNRLGEEAVRLHAAAIEAAYEAGARAVLYTSHMGARTGSPFAPAGNHAATEDILAATGRPFTALRHGFYAESCLHMVGRGIEAGEIRAPEDGPVSWTARADLAEADAVLLTAEERADGPTPPLTASDAITMDDLAQMASEVTTREIRRVTLSDEAWVEEKIAEGMPAPMAKMLLGTFHAARRGDFSKTDPALETLLGSPPRTMRDLLAERFSP